MANIGYKLDDLNKTMAWDVSSFKGWNKKSDYDSKQPPNLKYSERFLKFFQNRDL